MHIIHVFALQNLKLQYAHILGGPISQYNGDNDHADSIQFEYMLLLEVVPSSLEVRVSTHFPAP